MKLSNKGFTLIELLGVIIILMAILYLAIPSLTSSVERSKRKQFEQKKELIFIKIWKESTLLHHPKLEA